jgi:hypothetical protein
MAQVPPPPQAEGRNIFLPLNVLKSEDPADVTTGLAVSPLMMMVTSPDCTNLDWANRSIKTNKMMTNVKAAIEVNMIKDMSEKD